VVTRRQTARPTFDSRDSLVCLWNTASGRRWGPPSLLGTAFPRAKWLTSYSSASVYIFTAYSLQTRSGGRYRDWLWAGRTGVPNPVGAIRPERPRGPLSFLHNGCRVSYPGVKRSGGDVNHPSPSSAEVKERVELYLYSSSGSSWPVVG
jgi:hypothetical protein